MNLLELGGVVIADCDGQHTVEDINTIIQKLNDNPDSLVLGCRSFEGDNTPWKSKYGNNLTRRTLKYLCGIDVSDTQTGLRGIPFDFIKILMYTPGERYEYETNMLLECNNFGTKIIEVPIMTIYDSKEAHKTHFDPLIDSIIIYKVILAYSLSSVITTIIDFLIFSILSWSGYGIGICTGIARAVAAVSNFILNRKVVFRSKDNALKQFIKYGLLVFVSGTLSAIAITYLSMVLPFSVIFLKGIVETCLFFFNYYIQRTYIFIKRKGDDIDKSVFSEEITQETDWTEYYKSKKSIVSSFTQRYTQKKILYGIEKYVDVQSSLKICELGGGNSCFCKQICSRKDIDMYDIVDNNQLAVDLFNKLDIDSRKHNGICRDLLNDNDEESTEIYDFVYSIGLIEHFRGEDITTIIKRHFDYCKVGGIVFITFPTPTKKYLFIRKWMEIFGVWKFPDEKPLQFDDVKAIFESQGTVLEHFINRKLPLTQEVVIVRNNLALSGRLALADN